MTSYGVTKKLKLIINYRPDRPGQQETARGMKILCPVLPDRYFFGLAWCVARAAHHGDVIKLKHFPRYWPFVRGIHWWPSQRPVTRSFDVFFDLRLNKRLSKQSWGWWFETPSRSLWRHCNVFWGGLHEFSGHVTCRVIQPLKCLGIG